jgi:hypothetical protein
VSTSRKGMPLPSHQIEGTGSGHGAGGALETALAAKEALLLLEVGDASLSIVHLARQSVIFLSPSPSPSIASSLHKAM